MLRTTTAELLTIFRDLDIAQGDILLVHADLRVFGLLEGNGAGLLSALREAVGPTGLLCTPSFTFSFPGAFDVVRSLSKIGALTSLFSREQDVNRTRDGMTSYYMIGAGTDHILADWDHSSYGDGSVLGQLARRNGKVLQLGTDILSAVHLIEQRVGVPYRKIMRFQGLVIDGDKTYKSYTDFYARTETVKKVIPDPIRVDFYAQNKCKMVYGSREIRSFALADYISFAEPRLTENRLSLVEGREI